MGRTSREHEDGHRYELIRLLPKGESDEARFYWRCLDCPLVKIDTDYEPEEQPDRAA